MDTLSIGQLADRSGIHLETIRYYEREGLMPAPPRKSSGHRAYPTSAAKRLTFIKRAQELGFTLAEIREILALNATSDVPHTTLVRRTNEWIADINKRIEHLKAMEKALLQAKYAHPSESDLAHCAIIESLAG